MASSCSISLHAFPATSPHHHKLITIPTTNPKFTSSSSPSSHLHSQSQSQSLSRVPDSSLSCRCSHNSSPPPWDAAFQQLVKSAISKFSSFFNDGDEDAGDDVEDGIHDGDDRKTEDVDGAWDWDRWNEHFRRADEQQRIVSLLKSQLDDAIGREEFETASRLKVAIAASVTDDTVGRVISHLNRLLKHELYEDAVSLRDYAGVGLLGWWSGISENNGDPYGRIIRITAEHGRYVARSYSPRQLATSTVGIPLFEIFLAVDSKGEYRQQAVYLKRKGISQDFQTMSSRSPTLRPIGSSLSTLGSTEDKSNLFGIPTEDDEDTEDRDSDPDAPESLPGFQNILRDMIPGIKIKILKATPPEKVDTNLISKVIEQIMDEDEENDSEVRDDEAEDEDKVESDLEQDDIEMDSGRGVMDREEGGEIAVKVVVGGLAQKLSGTDFVKNIIRVPARLEKRGRFSFTFTIEDEESEQDSNGKGHASSDKRGKLQGQRSMESVMLDLAKFIGREKVPLKVLKDLGELINHSLSQARNGQPLSGSTTFNRIVLPVSPDPLNGLYVGAHGLYTYEVLHLTRQFGQWKDETAVNESSDLEFYEYVEAVKLTGDPYVPAGQVAFRAKVGKRYQLPHKGIIPDEFGVVARYRGQGRLAEPGFKNPRWVDGELVILDGKFIKGGPVVGFVYWAPEHHFLVFFNRIRLQE